MPPLVGRTAGPMERRRLENPGHLDQVTTVDSMTFSLAFYQIHFTDPSLFQCPVPIQGSGHKGVGEMPDLRWGKH